MARKCAICGRSAQTGSAISHAHNVSKRRFKINLQNVRIKTGSRIKKVLVCTKCLSANKVKKAT
jgi:large subunit ribosomal protein L28